MFDMHCMSSLSGTKVISDDDKTSKGKCVFHPSKPKHTGGSGSMLYS